MGNIATRFCRRSDESAAVKSLKPRRRAGLWKRRSPPIGLRQKLSDVEVIEEIAEAPRVDVPEHVVGEVVRGLLGNGLKALKGQEKGNMWVRLEPYRTAGAKVVIRVEDNGPGVPESIREHIFEPLFSTKQWTRAARARTVFGGEPPGYV